MWRNPSFWHSLIKRHELSSSAAILAGSTEWLGPISGEALDMTGKMIRAPASANRRSPPCADRSHLGAANPGSQVMKRSKRDPAREDRIHNEAIVDAYGP